MYSKSQCHIHLLSDQEIRDMYDVSQFNIGERTLYFSLTDEEMVIVKKYRTFNQVSWQGSRAFCVYPDCEFYSRKCKEHRA